MDHHFRAFSFVDRITRGPTESHIHGCYAIPSDLEDFPLPLVAEAVGQLAAWGAMARVQFQRRPVAGLAGCVTLLNPVRPGQTLTLTAHLETVDADAVAYAGSASADGVPVIQLEHCVGPMLPVADFDDPEAVVRRHALLCGAGATPGAFRGIPSTAWETSQGEAGRWRRASLQIPTEAALFCDHFPRRPVFPGTLMLQANLQLAAELARDIAPPNGGPGWKIDRVTDVKLRTFIAPSESLELEARLTETAPSSAALRLETRRGQRIVGGAQVHLIPQASP